ATTQRPGRSPAAVIACWGLARGPWPRRSTARTSRRKTSSAPRSGRRPMLEGAVRARGATRPSARARPRRSQVLAQHAPLATALTLLVAMLVIYVVLYAEIGRAHV